MNLRNPESSGFLIRGIDGLYPSKANINLSDMAGMDGSTFNSSSVDSRNIVFGLVFIEKFRPRGLEPVPGAEDLSIEGRRRKSYRYLPLKKRVEIEIGTNNRTCKTYGYVESNEVNIFSSQESSVISIVCPDPYLYDVLSQVTSVSLLIPDFYFPFSNESTSLKLIRFSYYSLTDEVNIYYEGESEVGIVITIHAIGAASGVKITKVYTLETIEISDAKLSDLTGDGIINGDTIVISTVKGDKFATLYRGSEEINILSCLKDDPDWFEISSGDNIFGFTATAGLSNLSFEVSNDVAYEGI